jgi:hypothetical protein
MVHKPQQESRPGLTDHRINASIHWRVLNAFFDDRVLIFPPHPIALGTTAKIIVEAGRPA